MRKGREVIHKVKNGILTTPKRYKNLSTIGQGSYGLVCSAFDSILNKQVAIKKITPISAHVMDGKHVLREIRLMRGLGRHKNVISLLDIFMREREDELYMVMELMDCDLHRLVSWVGLRWLISFIFSLCIYQTIN